MNGCAAEHNPDHFFLLKRYANDRHVVFGTGLKDDCAGLAPLECVRSDGYGGMEGEGANFICFLLLFCAPLHG
jgi:hypothetical protein